ncbi:catalase [Falsiruegeria mediterranea]|uniref:catalase n=1 Tax=Falsiruegeria mediterranea M17 TaxID=1200281 RepID=A0A2R8CGT3_9RHOB|nr:catalase [Falsiruegeria mediterranea]SPJ31488.1 Catalase-related peroxidase [Falsiruegeria mediterranea M17]
MNDQTIAADLVKALQRPDGDLNLRPVHTMGIGMSGHFIASDVARNFCIAAHFQGEKIPVTGRFSNGSGSATERDDWSDVRGMAIRFHLPDGTATDLLGMTLPAFFGPTKKTALAFIKASPAIPYFRENAWAKIFDYLRMMIPKRNPYPNETLSPDEGAFDYANKNQFAQLPVFGAATVGAPTGYTRADYHAVHTFIITSPDGVRRYVRFTWQPISGVQPRKLTKEPDNNYLHDELRDRLDGDGEAQFSLMMQLGEAGDDLNDCSRPWPPRRIRILMGTLTLDHVAEDQTADCEDLSFNPGLLTEGIEPSDDPILAARRDSYEISSEWRKATRCPFAKD